MPGNGSSLVYRSWGPQRERHSTTTHTTTYQSNINADTSGMLRFTDITNYEINTWWN